MLLFCLLVCRKANNNLTSEYLNISSSQKCHTWYVKFGYVLKQVLCQTLFPHQALFPLQPRVFEECTVALIHSNYRDSKFIVHSKQDLVAKI